MKHFPFLFAFLFLTSSCSHTSAGTGMIAASTVAQNTPSSNNPFNTDPTLNEYVLFIPAHFPDGDLELETTMYHPNTPPPWPLLVINHGADGTLPSYHDQPRFRPTEWAKFFLSRGYAVAAPMREGFTKSGGTYGSLGGDFNCDHAKYAEHYARDVVATIDFLIQIGQAKPGQIVVAGQSNGGMITLGYGAIGDQALGLINISGGVDTGEPGCDWKTHMIQSGSELGAMTWVPSLWMYADDDQTFPPSVSQPFFANYKTAGANATLQMYPSGGHGFALTDGSSKTWGPNVDQFLQGLGLPTALSGNF